MSIFPHADDEQKAEYEATRTASGPPPNQSGPSGPSGPCGPAGSLPAETSDDSETSSEPRPDGSGPCGPKRSDKWAKSPDGAMLDDLEAWLSTYVKVAQDEDMWTLVLWFAHTHFATKVGTTPRLVIDSPLPESGKTTVCEHAKHLCFDATLAAQLTSSSMLARMLEHGPKTIIVDEADRSLSPDKPETKDFIATFNSGYKRGATRPVAVPDGEGGWVISEMSTYGPVLMAGNAPDLPDDTRSRCITVLMLPDIEGTAEDSDWEEIEDDARELGRQLNLWANAVDLEKPEKLPGLRNRTRERFFPLYRVAVTAGGVWPDRCRQLIEAELERQVEDRESGLERVPRHLQLLRDIHAVWPEGEGFMGTEELLAVLRAKRPAYWGSENRFQPMTAKELGNLLRSHFNVRSVRVTIDSVKKRGYQAVSFTKPWGALGVTKPVSGPHGPDGSGPGENDDSAEVDKLAGQAPRGPDGPDGPLGPDCLGGGPDAVPSLAEQFPGLSVAGLISLEGADPNLAESPEELAAKIGCPVDIVIAELNRMEGLGNFD